MNIPDRKKMSTPLEQMVEDKRHISFVLQNGGTFEDLAKQGFKFIKPKQLTNG